MKFIGVKFNYQPNLLFILRKIMTDKPVAQIQFYLACKVNQMEKYEEEITEFLQDSLSNCSEKNVVNLAVRHLDANMYQVSCELTNHFEKITRGVSMQIVEALSNDGGGELLNDCDCITWELVSKFFKYKRI